HRWAGAHRCGYLLHELNRRAFHRGNDHRRRGAHVAERTGLASGRYRGVYAHLRAGSRASSAVQDRAVRRAAGGQRIRGRQVRVSFLHHALSNVPGRLRGARRPAPVSALDLRVVVHRAGRRGGHRDAGRERERFAPPALRRKRRTASARRAPRAGIRTFRASRRVLAARLANVQSPRPVMKEAIEEVGHLVAHDLARFLTTLGTIAAMSPLLGLFGTVVGMIEIFGSQTAAGSNPIQLAHGISVALYNTAFGLIVAIPSMIFYRHFRAKVDSLTLEMEQQAIKLVELAHGERR